MKKVETKKARPERRRSNQPTNYTGKSAIHKYKCVKHDYVYYGEDWIDSTTGKEFKRGYYDETGERFDNVIIENNGQYESQFVCDFCGASSKQVWTEGNAPHCSNCGANLIETAGKVIQDKFDNSTVTEVKYVETVGSKISRVFETIVQIGYFSFIGLIIIVMLGYFISEIINKGESKKNNTNIDLFGKTIHVDSINRDLNWNEEYESYYDSVSDCYVWYNTDVEPAVWQYWYEGISSDFGDYGWMEYELEENQWYIEKSNGNWIELPEKYDTSRLRYITGELAGTSHSKDFNLERFGNYITVDSSDAKCEWDKDMVSYKVSDKDCYIRVNFDVKKPSVQYWYEDISKKYCKDGYGGWLEYNYNTEKWSVVDENNNWSELNKGTQDLWHVEKYVTGETGSIFKVEESTLTINSDEENNNIYIDYAFYAFDESSDYKKYDIAYFYQGNGSNGMVDQFNQVDEDLINSYTDKYVIPHKDEISEFFDQEKDKKTVTDIDALQKSHYTLGNTKDVTEWFDDEIVIKDEDGTITHTYKINKVELAVKNDYYEADKIDDYDIIAKQYKIDNYYIYVDGISFEFFVSEK